MPEAGGAESDRPRGRPLGIRAIVLAVVVVLLVGVAVVGAGIAVLAHVFGTTDDEALAELDGLHDYSLRPGEGWVEEGPQVHRTEGRGWCVLGPECGSVVMETTWVARPGAEPLPCAHLPTVVREVQLKPAEADDGSCRATGVMANGSGYVDPVRWTLTLRPDGLLHVRLSGPVIVP